MKSVKLTVSALAVIAVSAGAAAARDQIQVAGSSTVLPFSNIVASAFGENTDFPAPVVESGGSGAGIKQFCSGVGTGTIDIANASRPIRESEVADCAANGVTEIMEVRIGYDGIVFASDINGPDFVFTPVEWFNAMAAKVLKDGEIIDNPNKVWSDVNPDLPNQPILAFIPGTKHGTREVFEENVLIDGCKEAGALDAFTAAEGDDKKKGEALCKQVRTDGVAVDIDGDYTETLARLDSSKQAIGVFGLSFYEDNTDKLKVASMSGVVPSVETIADGSYPVSRPLFFYVKKQHIGQIPGLLEFAEFFVSDAMAGAGGELSRQGLVADPKLADTQKAVADQVTLSN
ncbi:MAG: substrate-binding domain-containing protein [Paracoccus sp. (in: a-proteobacteria)]|uniref:substrate-binding domain-containing protein n=1 Tax=Paracoccus sp. TaxID=267 RepID=UPI0026DFCB89|nr:substrate-binding domain-containing protein [Paracoccus sp. (in: a-proteobacteria)]MDO5620940.1 substrate-binding domain-containing protein [Paracoccus sp. (in: a-proteobacteria)]